jgi:phosphatidylglycerophosphatase A
LYGKELLPRKVEDFLIHLSEKPVTLSWKKLLSSGIKEKFFLFWVTGGGSGLSPWAPGTAGSLLAFGIYEISPKNPYLWLSLSTLLLFASIPAVTSVTRRVGEKDPRWVVIDEIVALFFLLALLHPSTLPERIVGLFLFRAMDVLKPFPIRYLEKQFLTGTGVMVDDLVAGGYAFLLTKIAIPYLPF